VGLIENIESRETAWTVEELATVLSCSPKFIYKIVKQGKLKALRLGTLVRLDGKEVAEYLRPKQTRR
jgi:excisionase family DNA binding protein